MFWAASRQAGRSPSNAGRMMSTISGIWKYMYTSATPPRS
jgi:hypothetical protein